MTRGDLRLLAGLVAVTLLAAPVSVIAARQSSTDLRVEGPAGVSVIALDVDGRYVIDGREGQVVFEVSDGVARCVASSCPDQVCVRSGTVAPGRPVVCAPNGVIATVVGKQGSLDAISR